ncbi:MAG: N-acetylmuramoyl-L-alanine amidase [Coprococcus sp.]|nr:N-acetylmuramoyl-L-alanine amidase [Coprococcus sp.]
MKNENKTSNTLLKYLLITLLICCIISGITGIIIGCIRNSRKKSSGDSKGNGNGYSEVAASTEDPQATTEMTTELTTEATTEVTTEEEVDPVIVVLDPGHDSEYCTRNHPQLGMNEQDLNLTIALACRDRLEQYKGIKVYMTREDGSCPDPEDKGDKCIEVRTGIATDLNADLFVAIHCNGSTGVLGASPEGCEVYVPNYSAYTEDMTRLGDIICNNLTTMDIKSNGVKVRTKAEKGVYDDGSTQDWYYLISYSVEGGHPGIIIEHAYMDNTHDNEILKSEDNLKKMGELDADAIAEYYGLELKQ